MSGCALSRMMHGVAAVLMTIALVVGFVAAPVPAQAVTGGAASDGVATDGTVAVREDIPYMAPWGAEQTQKLDLYGLSESQETASATTASARPVVVFIHGGAWINGDKSFLTERMPLVNTLLASGYLVASVNYRLAAESPWPAQINDCKSAVRFLRKNAAKYGIDPNRIVVFGESAGAHLAMMMGVTNGNRQFDDSQDGNGVGVSSDVQAVISDFGIADVDEWGELSGDNKELAAYAKNLLFGVQEGSEYTDEQAKQASPISYVSSNAAPMLLAHGQNDGMVSYQQTVMMQKALERAGAKHVYTWYPENGPHASAEVFCMNITAQRHYLDFLSTVFPVKRSDNSNNRTVPVYRFYQSSQRNHLFSADANESVILNQNWTGWRNEGIVFRVLSESDDADTNQESSTRIISRMHNKNTDDYVYAGAKEARSLERAGWTLEATFRVPSTGGIPVYRLHDSRSGKHMLVTGASEKTALLARGWHDEGVAFRAYAADAK